MVTHPEQNVFESIFWEIDHLPELCVYNLIVILHDYDSQELGFLLVRLVPGLLPL